MSSVVETSTGDRYLVPIAKPKRPKLETPRDACDSHFHVFGPAERYPFSAERAYTPADAPLEAALQMHGVLGIERGVVVQGNPHGTDNSALLDALRREPNRLRGVAIVNEDIRGAELRRMRDIGVRALRFHHRPRMTGRYSAKGIESFTRLAPLMSDLDLHAQIFTNTEFLDELVPAFHGWKLPIVVDHFGSVAAAQGSATPPLQRLLNLLAKGRIWVKVSGVYRVSDRYPDYDDARQLHQALLDANAEQVLWGSDWPHSRLEHSMPDDGHLLDLFNEWTPNSAVRHKVLVENPARLYGFTPVPHHVGST